MAKVWWSALKKAVEDRFCEALRKRVQIHRTLYRGSHNCCQLDAGAGRFWILLDHEQIFSASDKEFWNKVQPLMEDLLRAHGSSRSGDAGWYAAQEHAKDIVHAQGIYSHYDCQDALQASLNLSIEDALESPHKLIKALAMIDKRLGKRRLQALSISEAEHWLVKRFYELRCATEDLSPKRYNPSL
ncbi:MAG: hypothetical protein M3347_05065 [Armatimonadota bacterium]|nr:hypothetical protein [Armatimonadota bacterium]